MALAIVSAASGYTKPRLSMKIAQKILIGLMLLIGIARFFVHSSKSSRQYHPPATPAFSQQEVQQAIESGDILSLLEEDDSWKDTMKATAEGTAPFVADEALARLSEQSERGRLLVLVGEDQLETVLKTMDSNEAIALLGQLSQNDKELNLGNRSFDDWSIQRNRVNMRLLTLLPQDAEHEPQPYNRQHIYGLVNEKRIEEAVDQLLAAGYWEAAQAKARLTRVDNALNEGRITAQVRQAAHNLVGEYVKYNF